MSSFAERYNSKLCASEMFASAVCNMQCKYCYIPKNEAMKKLHEQIIEGIRSRKFFDILEGTYGKELKSLSLWGTEPTLILHEITEALPDMLNRFENLETFGFSSNMLSHTDRIVNFIEELAKITDREIKVDLQFSLDGPDYITDNNRKQGATEAIIKNVLSVLTSLDKLDLKNIKVDSHFKPTLSIDNIRFYNENVPKLIDWFKLFDDIYEEFNVSVKNKDKISLATGAAPTFVLPGVYTKSDGEEAKEFFDNLYFIESLNRRDSLFKYITRFNNYEGRFSRMVRFHSEIPAKAFMFTCSGGDANLGIDMNGIAHICHRSFFMMQEEYTETVSEDLNPENWDVKIFQTGRDKVLREKFTADVSKKEDFLRFTYIMRNYHDFMTFRISQVVHLTKELAFAGQASQQFLVDDDLCEMFAMFVVTAFSCPAESVAATGVVHFTPVSIIRLLGNGAFESMFSHYVDRIKKGELNLYV